MNVRHSSNFVHFIRTTSAWTLPQGFFQAMTLSDPRTLKLTRIALSLYANLLDAPILVHL